ncbi:tRNA-dihydrouridine synthase [Candidatus Dojkabacteria bacterium]|jgi:nifR3 family TIM-barrel protein|nr:tRNA-dihydrouridine synthase [Candidatus Dojkabacteria bacterium]
MNIYEQLLEKSSITALAPMESVTDSVFRQIVSMCGRPSLFYTEFTNCDALVSSKGKESALQNLKYIEAEKPIIAQIWGVNPNSYVDAIKICVDLGFDGIDINMGCPVKKIIKSGGGAAMIGNKELAKEIIDISKDTISKYSKGFPLSVKTRVGYNNVDMEWIKLLLEMRLGAITFHVRTVKEFSKTKANWDLFKEISQMRNAISPDTKIIGNGDITTREQIKEYPKKYGVDGVMVGRGIFGNLWIFDKKIDDSDIAKEERLRLLITHIQLFKDTWGETKNLQILKKYFKIYIKDFEGASELRMKLMECNDYDSLIRELSPFI